VQVDGADYDTEDVGWDEAKLGGSKTNDADYEAVYAREDPAFPAAAADKNARSNC
jgi:hypothetical protein